MTGEKEGFRALRPEEQAQAIVSDPEDDGAVVLRVPWGALDVAVVPVGKMRPQNLTTSLRLLFTSILGGLREELPPFVEMEDRLTRLEERLARVDEAAARAVRRQDVRMAALEGRLAELPHLRQRLDGLDAGMSAIAAAIEREGDDASSA